MNLFFIMSAILTYIKIIIAFEYTELKTTFVKILLE